MPPATQIVDSLWQCFCPSFSLSARAFIPLFRRVLQKIAPAHHTNRQFIHYNARSARRPLGVDHVFSNYCRSKRTFTEYTLGLENPTDEHVLRGLPVSLVYEELRKSIAKVDYIRIQRIVRILVDHHGQAPSLHLYTALISANANAIHGSLQEVEEILQEMAEEGIRLDSSAYHALLKVLAIHPDFLIRNEVLDQLRAKWFTLTRDGWHDVVIGFLRERQVEMALDCLDQMHEEDIQVRPWLYDILIYTFCDTSDFDEVLRLMHLRLSIDKIYIPATQWYYILDSASQNYHLEATRLVWRHRVGTEQLNPPSGMCINVLNTAARHGDFHLANDVLRRLHRRNETLYLYHYEPLFESYLAAGELRIALSILPQMIAAKCLPTEATVRPLFIYLRTDPTLPGRALHTLQQLKEAGKYIPTVAINTIIEAGITHNDFAFSMQTYKILHTLSSTGPTTATFNALFRGCSKAGRKDTAMFLASEMLALKIPPDELTYDRLILVCIDAKHDLNAGNDTDGDFDDAFRYLDEMKERDWWPRPGTCVALAKRCVQRSDNRVWSFVDEMEERGMEVSGLQRWVGENWNRAEGRRREGERKRDQDISAA